jgi:hypothetical protein
MTRTAVVGCLVAQWILPAAVPAAQDLGIDHQAVGCVVAGQYPLLTARIAPAERVARARAYFRAHGTPHWYYVEMKGDAGAYLATLPRPKKDLERIDYYIEAMDAAFVGSRTAEFAPSVVASASACRKDLLAAAVTPAGKVFVGAPSGAPAVPVGFASTGVVSLGAGGAVAASGSSGVPTGLIVGGVAVAGGATAGVLVATKGDKEEDAPSCLAQAGEYFELALVCADINLKARVGCPMTLQVGVGRWATTEETLRTLAGSVGVITVDGVAQPVSYEGITLHQGGNEAAGYGNRARAVWTPKAGTHMLTGYWSLYPNDVSRCECTVTH